MRLAPRCLALLFVALAAGSHLYGEPPATAPATAPTSRPATPPSSQPSSQPAASQPAKKEWKETFPNGKIRALCPMVRDPKNAKRWVKHGLWQSWFENGKLEKEGNYKHGEMDGEWKIWFPGVDKPLIQVWRDGKRIS